MKTDGRGKEVMLKISDTPLLTHKNNIDLLFDHTKNNSCVIFTILDKKIGIYLKIDSRNYNQNW